MKKKRVGMFIIVVLLSVFLFTVVISLKECIENSMLYEMESELVKKFDEITNIEISNFGPYCDISVYLEKGEYIFEEIETIFIRLINIVLDEQMLEYLRNKHNNGKDGELPSICICFYVEGYTSQIYQFQSWNEFEVWELEGNSKITYKTSYYIDR